MSVQNTFFLITKKKIIVYDMLTQILVENFGVYNMGYSYYLKKIIKKIKKNAPLELYSFCDEKIIYHTQNL